MEKNKNRFTAGDIAYIGMMLAVIEVCKLALSSVPNIELTSFWLIMFTLCFGKRIVVLVPAFIILEGAIYGMNLWWIMYIYVWPLLVIVTWLFRRMNSALFYAILSGIFGLSFGFLCSLPYFFVELPSGGFQTAVKTVYAYWITGLPWDAVHGLGNFVIMLILYKPIRRVMLRFSGRTT